MRQKFNDGKLWERVQTGELSSVVIRYSHPAPEAANQPFCTQSQEVSYRDQTNEEIARVHQYLRPDQTLGGSRLPDPKRLLGDGVVYRLEKDPKPNQGTSGPQPLYRWVWWQIRRPVRRVWRKVRRKLGLSK